ncbi:MAG: glycosyltransferase family 2 protein [Lewinellaceae bacterium]|nr:glycosyltransferase family 2 protein [Lewinellaceae bacterium]
MLVSVVIPCFNAAPFIKRAVLSALHQRETGEVILVEDGSTDKSLQICEELRDNFKRVKLFHHPEAGNHGAGASRNLGIKEAHFDYIAFLDADDFYLEGRFTAAKHILNSHPNVEGVYEAAAHHFYSSFAKENYRLNYKSSALVTIKNGRSLNNLFETFLTGEGGWFHLDALTLRKEAVKKIGYFDETLRQTQDTDWILRLCLHCNLAAGKIDSPVAQIGIHDKNRIHNQKEANHYRFIMLKKWWVPVLQAPISKKAKLHFIRSYLDCHPWVRRHTHVRIMRKFVKGVVFLIHLARSPGMVLKIL